MTHPSTILIVDDEPSARQTLEALLFREGYCLTFAVDGPDALRKAAELTPDLILLDVMMPGMDGFETCRRLRADPRLAEIPVIMVTALDDRDSRLQGIEVGADDFVSKPFDRAELRARARAITRLNRYRRLLLERAKFEWVVEQADDGYVLLDEDDRILYANPRARLYLGLPAGTAEGTADTFLALAQRQYRCEPEELWRGWPGAATQSPRYLVRPPSAVSGEFWLQVDAAQMDAPGGALYAARLRDVTTDVQSQINVWSFQALVNHKLRTPLSIIAGFMDVLAHDLSGVLDEEQAFYLKTIQDSLARFQEQVLDILKYIEPPEEAEIIPGVAADLCRPADLPALAAEIGKKLGLSALTAACDAAAEEETRALSLPRQAMELILWELLGNAQKFHPRRSPAVEVTASLVDGAIRLRVGDDGLTLAPDQLLKMWAPYYQAEKGFSGAAPGMGLGLAMVARLVWRAGGDCRAYNRPDGPGVVVELALPLEK